VYWAVMPITLPGWVAEDALLIKLVILWFRRNLTPLARALASRGRTRPAPFLPLGLPSPVPSAQSAWFSRGAELPVLCAPLLSGGTSLNLTPLATRNSYVAAH